MQTLVKSIVLVSSLGVAGVAMAAEENSWAGSVDLGFTSLSGNSESETFTFKTKAERQAGDILYKLGASAANTEQSMVRTAENYQLSGRGEYQQGSLYYFGELTWDKDLYSGYDQQTALIAGAGYTFFDTEITSLKADAGPGYRVIELQNGGDEEELIVKASGEYKRQLNDNANFLQTLSYEWGDNNAVTRSLTELTAKLSSSLSAKLGYEVKHNSDVPVNTSSTDRKTVVSVSYSF